MIRLPPTPTLFPYTTLFRSSGRRPSPVATSAHWRDSRPASSRQSAPRKGADRKSTRLNSSHRCISYAVFCLKKKNNKARNDKLEILKTNYEVDVHDSAAMHY